MNEGGSLLRKDMRRLMRQLESGGCRVSQTRKHYRVEVPQKGGGYRLVFLSLTPSDRRTLLNSKALLRRMGASL